MLFILSLLVVLVLRLSARWIRRALSIVLWM
nr:MAG TPA: hypothetical protein [Caudoviricetes sp.]